GFADTVRAKKMRQDGAAEFISASVNTSCCKNVLDGIFPWLRIVFGQPLTWQSGRLLFQI
ncbi:MAG: hypothetical protein ACFN4Y_08750, partial [Centipeda sp. (in: firmicutes)]